MQQGLLVYKKLNLGCGWDIRDGFLNVDLHDFHKPDYVADILDLHELPSGHYDLIVAQDVLEHIERTKQVPALKEWARLLAPNGRLEIRLPSLFDMLRLGLQPGWFSVEKHTQLINMVYGTQAYNGDYHLAGHTALTLAGAGRDAGLVIANAAIHDGWLFAVRFAHASCKLSDEEFVHKAYFEELGRPVDPSGLRSSVAYIAKHDRTKFMETLWHSDEYRRLN